MPLPELCYYMLPEFCYQILQETHYNTLLDSTRLPELYLHYQNYNILQALHYLMLMEFHYIYGNPLCCQNFVTKITLYITGIL